MLARYCLFIIVFALAHPSAEGRLCDTQRLQNLPSSLNRLRNCTVITGNLIIVLFEKAVPEDYAELQFPELEEVWGFVVFFRLAGLHNAGKLFPNLRVIKGAKTFWDYSLIIFGLKDITEIGLHNLKVIERGKVKVDKCPKLCYVDTVRWDLLGTSIAKDERRKDCPVCNPKCKEGCWSGEQCQDTVIKEKCEKLDDHGLCVEKCPPEQFMLHPGNICVTAEECSSMEHKVNEPEWFAFNRTCINRCPIKHENTTKEKGWCNYCGDECIKICNATEISSSSALEELRGCTIINNNLTLRVGNQELANELVTYLGEVRVIRHYLKIQSSGALKDLKFLRSLREIKGEVLDNSNAVAVYKNTNLSKLFEWDFFNLTIGRGDISFHDNPKLCISEIELFSNRTNIRNPVSLDSNGYQANCLPVELNMHILQTNPTNATLEWKILNMTEDTLVTVYYKIDKGVKENSISLETESCDADDWNIGIVDKTVLLTNLKPFTTYVYYLVISDTTGKSYKSTTRTELGYFKTLPDDPSAPQNVQAVSLNESSINLTWEAPLEPQGEILEYTITGYMQLDDQSFTDQRNYCTRPHTFPTSQPKEPTKKPAIIKPDDECFCEEDENISIVPKDSAVIAGDDAFKEYNSYKTFNDHLSKQHKMVKRDYPSDSRYFIQNVPANQTNFVFTNLEQFTLYIFYVGACNKDRPEGVCGEFVMVYERTKYNLEADKVTDLRVFTEGCCNVTAKWSEPVKPNALIVSYNIEYKRVDSNGIHPICISRKEHEEKGSTYNMGLFSAGTYVIRIKAISLSGKGIFSKYYKFTVGSQTNFTTVAIITLIVVITLSCLSLYIYCRWKKRRELDNTRLIPTINPDYAGQTYVEDEWEIPRVDVEMYNALGQGTFGMVYSGRVKSLNLMCAIKTVNDTATLEERNDFLSEADVMKLSNKSHHVVRLIGVVSRGQPPLVIMELMGLGDLKSFLRRSRESSQSITSNEMFRMSIEIADGMAYLSAKKFIHRDLAARNCMVAGDHTVKIGDFGMARDIYETDYYRKESKGLLPVRWMAPESLADGVFTTDSDVWSYGIVLWEMATLAEQPYQGFSNEQVLNFVITRGRLSRPPECPEILYEIMEECWRWKPNHRPLFSDIVEKLESRVSENFKVASFYHSKEGTEHRLHKGPRPVNMPAMSVPADAHLFARYNVSDEDISFKSEHPKHKHSYLSSHPYQRKSNILGDLSTSDTSREDYSPYDNSPL